MTSEYGVQTTLDLDAIEARVNAATPGPWFNAYRRVQSEPAVKRYTAEEAAIPDDATDDDPRWDALPEVDVCAVPVSHGDTPTTQGQRDAVFIAAARADVPALAAEVRRLRSVEHERDFLKRREQDIIDATEPADGGQYRNDIVNAIQRQRLDLDKAREEARLWKALAQARGWYISGSPGEREAATMAECKAIDKLHRAGIDPDAPEQG